MIGVVADDITGANDIGIMFAKANYLSYVFSYNPDVPLRLDGVPTPDVLILDTNSRFDEAKVAYRKVFSATKELQQMNCRQYINKTSSAFCGDSIGAEFDAMLDMLHLDFALVVVGFPKNGRTTIEGIHYVHGQKLSESPFRHDPVHPMTKSSLVEILQNQTERPVGLINHEVVAKGPGKLRQEIAGLRDRFTYVVLDVVDQAALRTIAAAVYDETVLCGSSAIAEELPGVWNSERQEAPLGDLPPWKGTGLLVTAGSLTPQTAGQIAYLREQGRFVAELNSLQLLDPVTRAAEEHRLITNIVEALKAGTDVVLHSSNTPAVVSETKAAGQAAGFSLTAVSRLVSNSLAEVTANCLRETGQNRLVTAGGDTSAAVCARLGVQGMRVWREIEPGIPSCLSLSDPAYLLVLKSGSFGSREFLAEAIDHLKSQGGEERTR